MPSVKPSTTGQREHAGVAAETRDARGDEQEARQEGDDDDAARADGGDDRDEDDGHRAGRAADLDIPEPPKRPGDDARDDSP